MCGGGSLNRAITEHLQAGLPKSRVISLDGSGVPSSAKEAVSFALQGLDAVLGRQTAVPINFDSLTANTTTGKTAPWKEWTRLMTRARNFGGGRICRWWRILF